MPRRISLFNGDKDAIAEEEEAEEDCYPTTPVDDHIEVHDENVTVGGCLRRRGRRGPPCDEKVPLTASPEGVIVETKLAMAVEFDHMYSSGGSSATDSKASIGRDIEVHHLKEMLLLHLDLIQQQSDQLVAKDKQIKALRDENENLRAKLERIDRRVALSLQKRPNEAFSQESEPVSTEVTSPRKLVLPDSATASVENKNSINNNKVGSPLSRLTTHGGKTATSTKPLSSPSNKPLSPISKTLSPPSSKTDLLHCKSPSPRCKSLSPSTQAASLAGRLVSPNSKSLSPNSKLGVSSIPVSSDETLATPSNKSGSLSSKNSSPGRRSLSPRHKSRSPGFDADVNSNNTDLTVCKEESPSTNTLFTLAEADSSSLTDLPFTESLNKAESPSSNNELCSTGAELVSNNLDTPTIKIESQNVRSDSPPPKTELLSESDEPFIVTGLSLRSKSDLPKVLSPSSDGEVSENAASPLLGKAVSPSLGKTASPPSKALSPPPNKALSPPPNKAASPSSKALSPPPNKAASPSSKALSPPPNKAASPSSKAVSPSSKAITLSRKTEFPSSKAESPSNKTRSPFSKAESPSNKAESPSRKTESPSSKTDSSIGTCASSPKSLRSDPTKRTSPKTPSPKTSPREKRLRKDAAQSIANETAEVATKKDGGAKGPEKEKPCLKRRSESESETPVKRKRMDRERREKSNDAEEKTDHNLRSRGKSGDKAKETIKRESSPLPALDRPATPTSRAAALEAKKLRQKLLLKGTPPVRRPVRAEGILNTSVTYYLPYGGLIIDPNPEEECLQAQVEIPRWGTRMLTSLYVMEGTENLEDEIFLKRHAKPEQDEKRRKRWDLQRMREQRHYERLRERYESRQNAGEPEVSTHGSLWPNPESSQYLQVDDCLPVCAFGQPMARIPPEEFALPWLSGQSQDGVSTRRRKR